jgi:DNA mismatch repair protein MSH4
VINEDATWAKGALGLRHQRCYAVKVPPTSIRIDADGQSGVNGLLDVARQNFKEVTSDVFTLIDFYKSIYLS